MTENHKESEKQYEDRMNKRLMVDEFKLLGKGDDYLYQSIHFSDRANSELSLAAAVLDKCEGDQEEFKRELQEIRVRLIDFQYKLRGNKVY